MKLSSKIEKPFEDKTPYILYGLMFGILYWIVDAGLDYFIFYKGYGFWDILLNDLPAHELYVRLSIFVMISLFMYYLKFLRRRELKKQLYANFLQLSFARINKLSVEETPQDLFDPIVNEIHDTMKIPFVKILRLTEDGEDLLLASGIGWKDGLVGSAFVMSKLNSQAGYTLLTDSPVVVKNLIKETRFSGPDLLMDHNIKSGVSIVIKVDRIQYGILAVHSQDERYYTTDEITYLESLSNLVAVSLNKHNLQMKITQEKNKFVDLYENSPDMLLSVDLKTLKIIQVNKSAVQILGYSEEELYNIKVSDLYHPSQQEKLENHILPFYKEHGYLANEEVKVVKKNGDVIDVILNSKAIRDENGVVIASRSSWTDITESKQLKVVLEENARSLQRLNIIALTLYEVTDAILRISDPHKLFSEIAEIIVKNGYSLSWIVWEDQNTKQVHSATKSNISAIEIIDIPENWGDHQHSENCPIGECRDNGEIIIKESSFEDEHISNWRELMRIKKFLSSIYLPIKYDEKVIGVVSVYSDTMKEFSNEEIKLLQRLTDTLSYALRSIMFEDERIRLQDEVEDGESEIFKLMTSIEQIDSMLLIVDLERNIEYANPAFKTITQYDPIEVSGDLDILFDRDINSEVRAQMKKALVEGIGYSGILKGTRKNGEYYYGDTLITPFKNKDGEVANLIIIQKDVTLEHKMQNELMQSQKMDAVGRMSSGIAHDFKNLMGVISLSADYINMLTKNEDIKREVTEIHETIGTGTSIIQKLLTFSKTTSEDFVLFDPQIVITKFGSILRRLITTRIGIDFIISDKIYRIKGWENSFEQVLLNLIVNSRDAMPEGGTIKIITDLVKKTVDQFVIDENSSIQNNIDEIFAAKKVNPGYYFLLQVVDDGFGIPIENQEKIFEPFFTTKIEGDGTGLGLATVYGIIKDFNGFIGLRSGINEGTTFHILIPAIKINNIH